MGSIRNPPGNRWAPARDDRQYPPYATNLSMLRCPSDPGFGWAFAGRNQLRSLARAIRPYRSRRSRTLNVNELSEDNTVRFPYTAEHQFSATHRQRAHRVYVVLTRGMKFRDTLERAGQYDHGRRNSSDRF